MSNLKNVYIYFIYKKIKPFVGVHYNKIRKREIFTTSRGLWLVGSTL